MTKGQKHELIFVFLIFAFVLFMFLVSQGYHPMAKQFPQLVAGLILILLVWELVVMIFRRGGEKAPKKSQLFQRLPRKILIKRWLAIGLSLVVYVLLLPKFGFVVMTSLFMLSLLWFLDIKRPLLLVLYTGLTVGLLYVIFVRILLVPLPSGTLW